MDPPAFSNYWRTGYNLGMSVGREFSHLVALEAAVDYHSFELSTPAFAVSQFRGGTSIVAVAGGAAQFLTVTMGGKVKFSKQPHPIEPYLTGGLGFFWLSVDDAISYADGGYYLAMGRKESAPVGYVGIGVDLPASPRTDLFFQIAYESGFTNDRSTTYAPLKFGARFRL